MDAKQLEAFLAGVVVTECEEVEVIVEFEGLTVIEICDPGVMA